jgi:hypothetical protein
MRQHTHAAVRNPIAWGTEHYLRGSNPYAAPPGLTRSSPFSHPSRGGLNNAAPMALRPRGFGCMRQHTHAAVRNPIAWGTEHYLRGSNPYAAPPGLTRSSPFSHPSRGGLNNSAPTALRPPGFGCMRQHTQTRRGSESDRLASLSACRSPCLRGEIFLDLIRKRVWGQIRCRAFSGISGILLQN